LLLYMSCTVHGYALWLFHEFRMHVAETHWAKVFKEFLEKAGFFWPPMLTPISVAPLHTGMLQLRMLRLNSLPSPYIGMRNIMSAALLRSSCTRVLHFPKDKRNRPVEPGLEKGFFGIAE